MIRIYWDNNTADDFLVDPKTLGQYIVRKDKNDRKIFSGDIVRNGFSGKWIIQPLEYGSFSLLGIDKNYKGRTFSIDALNKNAEVIGNVFDDTELLEVQE
jgi:uncharacterized phage protein (TIGR01671 family)